MALQDARVPPAEVEAWFWDQFGHLIGSEARVFSLGRILPTGIQDSRGYRFDEFDLPPLEEGETPTSEEFGEDTWVFFVDHEPSANWAHEAAYAAMDLQKSLSMWTPTQWPPEAELVVEVARPVVDNVVGERVDWELRREMATAPRDVKHFGGVARCLSCGQERRVVVRAPAWAYGPLPVECEACGGWALLVHHEVPVAEGEEPYFVIVVPAPDGPGGPE